MKNNDLGSRSESILIFGYFYASVLRYYFSTSVGHRALKASLGMAGGGKGLRAEGRGVTTARKDRLKSVTQDLCSQRGLFQLHPWTFALLVSTVGLWFYILLLLER